MRVNVGKSEERDIWEERVIEREMDREKCCEGFKDRVRDLG